MRNNFRTDLKTAKNLGSSGHGVKHWLHQRLSAITTILLMLWLISFIYVHCNDSVQNIIYSLKKPLNFTLFVLLTISSFYHGVIGMQVVVEDYINNLFIRNLTIISLKIFVSITSLLLFISIYSI